MRNGLMLFEHRRAVELAEQGESVDTILRLLLYNREAELRRDIRAQVEVIVKGVKR